MVTGPPLLVKLPPVRLTVVVIVPAFAVPLADCVRESERVAPCDVSAIAAATRTPS